ncbi:YPDG domain-containing protein [Corynebacterium suedekumii]|nr:YPDG domain-containing protein [Corynebacterium suedekumii]
MGKRIPKRSKVVADRHGSIEEAELKDADIDINEETGAVTVSFPTDRQGTLWFRTELFYPDGTFREVHYTFEITDTPQEADDVGKLGSSLSSK